VFGMSRTKAPGLRPVKEANMTPPLAYSIPEACASSRMGRTTLYEAIRTGELRAVKRGRRTLILVDDLKNWITNLPAVPVLEGAGPPMERAS
jgi:excisionase family DNA binding protein